MRSRKTTTTDAPAGPARAARTNKAAARRARTRGRETQPPLHIRVLGATVGTDDRERIVKKLGRSLGKFAASIERISVRLSDVNGPKGGIDHKCLIKTVLAGLPSVVVERLDSTPQRAADAAVAASGRAVRRSVQRRRLKPLHRRKSPAVAAAS